MTGGTFTARLNHLIASVHPSGRGPYSDKEIAEGCGHLSRAYVGNLRKGQQANPSLSTMRLLAGFFGIPTSYFTAEDPSSVDDQLALAAVHRDAAVQDTLMRMSSLSSESVSVMQQLSQQLADLESRHAPEQRPGRPET